MRLACLDLLECTAGKVHALRWVFVLQMSSVMFVIFYLKNARAKHSTETKPNHHRRQHSAKSLLVQYYKTISNDCLFEFIMIRSGHKIFAVLSLLPCFTIIGDTGKLMENEAVAWPYIG